MEKYPKAIFQTKFNQVNHEFEIYLDSSAGQSDSEDYKYPINPNAIVNLNIENTLADWAVRGTLTIFYNPEAGSGYINPVTGNYRDAASGVDKNNTSNPELKPFYDFRNDGYDLLRIRIKPRLSDTNLPNNVNVDEGSHWSLSYLFSIYDMEDVDLPPGAQNQAAASIKCLKIYFWDEWYQRMLTNTLEYSTAEDSESSQADVNGEYANGAVVETGRAMKSIIEKALKDVDSTDGVPCGSEIADSSGYADWELGAAKIFYTAPAQTTAYESLMYVYKKHISNEEKSLYVNDFSLLAKDKDPNDETSVGRLTLKPITSYFKKAGSTADAPGLYQIEHFFLQGYTDGDRPTKSLRAPFSQESNKPVDFKSLKYGTISNYRFVDMAAVTNTTQFANTPVYSFDFKNRTFNAEFKNNSVLTARDFMSEKYIKEVYKSNKTSLDKLFLINLDKDKKDKNIKPAFSLHGDDPAIRQHAGLQKLLYVGLFQNAAINFRTLGLSFREPGRFIAVDRTEGVEGGTYEDKFYGQWFIVDIKHIFESEFYYNDITAIKIHRFQELKSRFPGLLEG